MACVDHVCRTCKHGWFSNRCDEVCEMCGGSDIKDSFDEADDDDRYEWESDCDPDE